MRVHRALRHASSASRRIRLRLRHHGHEYWHGDAEPRSLPTRVLRVKQAGFRRQVKHPADRSIKCRCIAAGKIRSRRAVVWHEDGIPDKGGVANHIAVQARAGTVKWPCASVFGLSGLVGALAGAHLAKSVNGAALLHWFAFAMIAIAVSMLIPRKNEGDPAVHLTPGMVWKLAPVGLIAGFAAGLFGIGGGFLIAPGLMASTGMTLANAAASSLVSVTLFGGATSASYAATGQVAWPLFGTLVAGGVVGAALGLPISRWMVTGVKMARIGFAILVVTVAVYILLAK